MEIANKSRLSTAYVAGASSVVPEFKNWAARMASFRTCIMSFHVSTVRSSAVRCSRHILGALVIILEGPKVTGWALANKKRSPGVSVEGERAMFQMVEKQICSSCCLKPWIPQMPQQKPKRGWSCGPWCKSKVDVTKQDAIEQMAARSESNKKPGSLGENQKRWLRSYSHHWPGRLKTLLLQD